MGLLNGLSALGASTAAYAATAGLEAQKQALAQQNLQLADQLATNREVNVTQPFQASQLATSEAGATARSAASNATSLAVANTSATSAANVTKMNNDAQAGVRAAQAKASDAASALSSAQTAKLNAVTGLQSSIADEYAQPNPDQGKIRSLTSQLTAYTTDAQTQGAIMSSLASQSATAQAEVARLTQQRDTEINTLSGIQYDDALKAQKQAAVDGLNQQIAQTKARADAFANQAAQFSSNRANLPNPMGAGAVSAPAISSGAPPAGASLGQPPAASGIINSTGSQPAPSPSTAATGGISPPTATAASVGDSLLKSSSAASGTTAPVTSTPANADGSAPSKAVAALPPAAAAAGVKPAPDAAATPALLPGDTNATSLDALKTARPDLNVDVLKNKSPAVVGIVMQMVDGRATLPPLNSRNPDAIMLRALASEVDPNLDEATSKARMATRVSVASGPLGAQRTIISTAIGHAAELYNNTAILNNSWQPMANAFVNGVASAGGSDRPNNVQLNVNALAGEMTKVYSGTGGNLAEVKAWEDAFPVNGSLTQQRGAIQTAATMLQSKLVALADQINVGMGRTVEPVSLLTPGAQTAFLALTGKTPIPEGGFKMDGGSTGYMLGKAPTSNAPTTAPAPASGASPGVTPPKSTAAAPANSNLLQLWGQ